MRMAKSTASESMRPWREPYSLRIGGAIEIAVPDRPRKLNAFQRDPLCGAKRGLSATDGLGRI